MFGKSVLIVLAFMGAILLIYLGHFIGRNHSLFFGDVGETARVLSGDHRELSRVTSPDGLVDAVLIEIETDSLSVNSFIVCLVPANADIANLSGSYDPILFYGNRMKGFRLSWREPKFLEFHYDQAKIMTFRSEHWLQGIGDKEFYKVELRLVPSGPYSTPE